MNHVEQANAGRITLAVLLLVILFLCGVWDIVAVYKGHSGLTVSDIVHEWATRWMMLPFLAGVLVGHLFWRS